MKELLNLLFHFQLKKLFFEDTQNGMIKFFRYCFVGGIAFVADYAAFFLVCLIFGKGSVVNAIAVAAGFVVGILVNFAMSKKFVFTQDAKNVSKKGEFIWYAAIGIVGLLLSELLMLVCTAWVFELNRYLAKIIVSLIVLVYNYTARKLILY